MACRRVFLKAYTSFLKKELFGKVIDPNRVTADSVTTIG